jgi:hypothetical protein
MGLAITIIVLLGLFLKYGTGKKGRVHLKECKRDSTCTCYSDDSENKSN